MGLGKRWLRPPPEDSREEKGGFGRLFLWPLPPTRKLGGLVRPRFLGFGAAGSTKLAMPSSDQSLSVVPAAMAGETRSLL
jgi:hypothetical protein